MSAQEFKPGDRVRLIDGTSPISGHEGTREFTVEEVFADAPRAVRLAGVQGVRGRDRFEKVEPEFVVGQQVSGDDYDRLPVAARAEDKVGDGIVKTAEDVWQTDTGRNRWPLHPRTLTHLPAAPEPEDTDDVEPEDERISAWETIASHPIFDSCRPEERPLLKAMMAKLDRIYTTPLPATELEDKADLYVEPEPLKEGDWVWVAGQVTETHHHPEDITVAMSSHNEQYQADVRRDRVKPMEGAPDWVARCTSLIECDEGAGVFYLRCSRTTHDDAAHRLSDSGIDDLAWTDSDEGVMRIEGGA